MGDAGVGPRFGVLGPLRAWRHGHEVDLGWPKQQAVLAVLLLRPDHAATRDVIVDALWGDDPPSSAQNLVHTYVRRLRHVLEPDRGAREPGRVLIGTGSGYALRLAPGQLDLDLFSEQVRQARRWLVDDDPARALADFDAALALWRGTPLSGIPGPYADAERVRLGELRLATLEDRAEAMLALGRHAQLAAELPALVAEHPLRERLRALQMTALHRSGRRADALNVYADTRRLMVDELGIEPDEQLRRLHQDILNDRDIGPTHAGRTVARVPEPVVPRQLPPAVRHFVGRAAELATLTGLIQDRAEDPMAISVIDGTAGIGKTAVALHWAHQVAGEFPDGQLYVNLRGFDPAGSAMTPAEALHGFLDALGVPAERIPASAEARTALYRSLLAGRRMLVVLDNARDAGQVRPLLPGAPGCVAVVTSRSQLSGLVAAEGAHRLTLATLSTVDAEELLVRRLGPARVAAEPGAVAEIIARCARLPLALTIVAARAAAYPEAALASVADELRDDGVRLDALSAGDPAADVRAAFSWSYRRLTDPAAALFRLLGLHGGPDISTPAVASLAGLPARRIQSGLVELARAHLVTEHVLGRFAFHDLLRVYATELTEALDPAPDRHAALRRVLDHYLHTAHRAALLLDPYRDPIPLGPRAPGVAVEPLADHRAALAWFGAEYPVLLAAVRRADAAGFDAHVWQLAWTLTTFMFRRAHLHDWVRIHRLGLAAGQRSADVAAQATSHRALGRAYTKLRRYGDAARHLRDALDLYRGLGDGIGQAQTHINLGQLHNRQGNVDGSVHHTLRAIDLFRAAGHRDGEARALNTIGWYHAQAGDYPPALRYCQRALDLHREIRDRAGEAAVWDSLGYIRHRLGEHGQASICYQHAVDLLRELGDQYHEAVTLTHLGDNQHAAGNVADARTAWRSALKILDRLDHPDAGPVRAKLGRLPGPARTLP